MAIPADALAPVVHRIAYDQTRLVEERIDAIDRLAVPPVPGIAWIDVTGFGDEAKLRRIGEMFGLHPLLLADIVNTGQRPKIEAFDDRYLIVLGQPHPQDTGEIWIEQVSIVLGPGWVLTFQERPGDPFEPVRVRLRAGLAPIRRSGADYLAYTLVDALVDSYFPLVEQLGARIDALEATVIADPAGAPLLEIHTLRRNLLTLHRHLWQTRDALSSSVREESAMFGPSVRVYLRDVVDHVMQALDMTEGLREFVVSLFELYQTGVSNRLNEVMKTLTVMASIFIPLTFVVGIYGMNFEHMPELAHPWAYPAVWLVMVSISVGMLLWFRRRGWIGRRRQRRDGTSSTSAIAAPPNTTS